jgi:serine/threonine protein kinase
MEHCSGETLREFMDTKDFKVNRKVNYHYFKQLISGLQHIHEESLIHRDIKPANIFIDKARMSLKIGDFGLAKQNNVQQELS